MYTHTYSLPYLVGHYIHNDCVCIYGGGLHVCVCCVCVGVCVTKVFSSRQQKVTQVPTHLLVRHFLHDVWCKFIGATCLTPRIRGTLWCTYLVGNTQRWRQHYPNLLHWRHGNSQNHDRQGLLSSSDQLLQVASGCQRRN